MLKKSLALVALGSAILSLTHAEPAKTTPVDSLTAKTLPSSYMPVVIAETFQDILKRMSAAKKTIKEN